MSKYQRFQNAIEGFQPGSENAPILYVTTEVNEKGFKALSGRKLRLWASHTGVVLLVCACILVAASLAAVILTRQLGGTAVPAAAAFMPAFITVFLMRATLLTVTDVGLDFYFLEIKFGGYAVSDKISLPYNRISRVKVKAGKVFKYTYFTFWFDDNGKSHKIKISVSNRVRKMQEQSENLNVLLETLERKYLSFD